MIIQYSKIKLMSRFYRQSNKTQSNQADSERNDTDDNDSQFSFSNTSSPSQVRNIRGKTEKRFN